MIDYLEQLFVLTQEGGEEKTEVDFRVSPPYEPVGEMTTPVLEAGETAAMPVASLVADWQEEGAQRLESALTQPLPRPRPLDSIAPEELVRVRRGQEEPAFALREGLLVSRPQTRDTQQDLERRLRRDSRRYDSGFFWY